MKPSFSVCLLCVMLTVLRTGKVQAGLAEATDFSGPWMSGSSSGSSVGSDPGYWVDQQAMSLDGVDAARGGLGGLNAERTWIETQVTGPTTLWFSYKVAELRSNFGADFDFLVNGLRQATLATVAGGGSETVSTSWKEASFQIGSGVHKVRWQLGAFQGSLSGRAYVDQVWTIGDPRPRITATTVAATYGSSLQWTVPVFSNSPVVLSAADLPPGITLSPDRRSLIGTPTQSGKFESTLTADNTAGRHIAKVTIEVETNLSEALDMPLQPFAQGSAQRWEAVSGFGIVGGDSVQTSVPAPVPGESLNRDSFLSTTVTGPGILSFWLYLETYADASKWESPFLLVFPGDVDETWEQRIAFESPQFSDQWGKVVIDVPAGRHDLNLFGVRHWLTATPSPLDLYIDGMTFESSLADISVTAGETQGDVADGGRQSFGSVSVGSAAELNFTIHNSEPGYLRGLGTTIEGPEASSFSLVTSPVAPVLGPNGTTTFSVRFAPLGTGTKTAVLRIESNDPDENPFTIRLVGYGTVISVQPVGRVVGVGEATVFSVGTGVPGAAYQWRKDGRDIPGEVGPSLAIAMAKPWQIGEYSVVVTSAAGTEVSAPASLRLEGVPEGLWRGLVSYYPFDGHVADVLRPGSAAELANGASVMTDAERGGVASMNGKGFTVPALPSEELALQGPGGFIRIPRPVDGEGESYTMSLWVKERGYSSWHGESFLTFGEGAAAPALVGHYWVGGLEGQIDHYGAIGTLILEPVPPSTAVVSPDGSAVISQPEWKNWTIVGLGQTVSFYRDGEYRGSLPYPAAVSGDVFLGRHWWMDELQRYSTRFRGEVDDLRFYNRALTADEVRQLHAGTRPAPPPTTYDAWAQAYGLSGSSAGLGEDPDGDGWLMIEEYLFGTDPARPTVGVAQLRTVGGSGLLEWLGRQEADYTVTTSEDLRSWRPLGVAVVPAADQTGVPAGYERLEAGFPLPAARAPLSLEALRIEGVIAPFLADGGVLEMQPAGGEATAGSEVVLGPSAGLPWETYQWLKNGTPVPGATRATLRLPAAQLEDSGLYQLVVSNGLGSAQSRETYLRVSAPSLATVRTISDSSAGVGQVTIRGLVETDGGLAVVERGVVFGSGANPTVENGLRIPSGNGPGFFQATAFGVAAGTPVHARAYARTTQGVAYGENRTVTLPGG